MERLDHKVDTAWHVALNAYHADHTFEQWMYEAKQVADETGRLAMLFEMERTGKLVTQHHQCSRDVDGEPVPDNHLTCCLGVECRACPFLAALDKTNVAPEQIDQIKAWTCVTHIVKMTGEGRGGFDTSEGYVLTVDDRMYWNNLYSSLANANEEEEIS